MFDIELIKHILKYEIKWCLWRVMKFTFVGLLLASLLFLSSEDGDSSFSLLLLFAVFTPIFISTSSSLSPRMLVDGNQQSQSGCFSWKYLHSTIPNRKSFVVAYCIAGIVLGIPPLMLGALISIIYEVNIIFVLLSIPVALLLLFQFRLSSLIQTIEAPRRIYFKYNNKSETVRFLRLFIDTAHRMLNGVLFFISITIVATFFMRFHIGFAGIVVPMIFLFTINYSLNYLLKIWRNENYSFWQIRREIKKTFFRSSIVAIFFLAHYVVFGLDFDNENKVFHLVADKQIEELEKYKFDENDLNRLNSDGYGLIHLAIDNHDIESVRLLVEKGSSIETRIGEIISKKNAYKTGFTPLMYAIDRGAIEIAQYFISKNAELNVKSHKGFSAISLASFKCYPELVKMLKDNGADIEIKSESGLTPIFYTIQGRGCLSAFIYLKDNGANLKWKNKKDQNYLEYAKKSNIKMFKELNFMFNL